MLERLVDKRFCLSILHYRKYLSTLMFALTRKPLTGEVSEWSKEHAWKVCIPHGIEGSNPSLSANRFLQNFRSHEKMPLMPLFAGSVGLSLCNRASLGPRIFAKWSVCLFRRIAGRPKYWGYESYFFRQSIFA